MTLMHGRRGLIVGVANARSLAFGIAKAARDEGARLAVTYQSERLALGVRALAAELQAELCLPLDVTQDAELRAVRQTLEQHWGAVDFVVHAVAHARKEELEGPFIQTSREGFHEALEVSAYSLVALAREFAPLLASGVSPSLLTLTYLGSGRAVPNYNVMGVAKAALEAAVRYLAMDLGPRGIRVNAVSAGAVKTLSAAGVRGLRSLLAFAPQVAPLGRNVDSEDVGRAALFLLSDLSRATTGQVLFVDAGFNIVGVPQAPQGVS